MSYKNKGLFSVILNEDTKKYVIVYNEKGIITTLNDYTFLKYEDGIDFIKSNRIDLDKYITDLKEEEKKRFEEEEAARKLREEEEQKAKEEKERKRKQFAYDAKRFIAGFLAGVVTLVGGHFLAKGISPLMKSDKTDAPSLSDDVDKNTVSTNQPITDSTVPTETQVEEVKEVLTNEKFEELTTNFTKLYTDRNVNVETQDLVKFVSIINIDRLVEENPELANELFNQESKEEYLNDAAKIIGMTYTYNRNVYEKEGSTENFIKISESLIGNQKEQMLIIEDYVNRVVIARGNSEEVNKIVSEFLVRLSDPESDLSYLDDGVGFGMQVNIELIRSYFAKDDLSDENRDWLTTLTSSEKYVSNIFTVYDKCVGLSGMSKSLNN